jgi:hypothetical protein
MPNISDIREFNNELFDQLSSNDTSLVKNAEDAVTKFVRTQVREDGVFRAVFPMLPVTAADLTPQLDTDDPVIILEKEPSSPGAVSVPFMSTPIGWFISGDKFRVTFNILQSPRFIGHLSKLRTYRMDIRQVISDNSLRDILAQEDSAFFQALNAAMGGVADGVSPMSGAVQWQTIGGGISRDSVTEIKKILPSTSSHLEAVTAIVNNVTVNDFVKWGRDEIGGDKSQDMLVSGKMLENMLGLDWHVTIKRHLVPDSTVFLMADTGFIGKSFVMEDVTLHIKREAMIVQWYAYEEIGSSIAHAAGIGRADFN